MHCRLFVISMSTVLLYAQQKPWTQQYRFSYSGKPIISKEAIPLICKKNIPASTQIMCTWNAVRPVKGYYAFYLQVHSVKQKMWSSWHKIADWGARIQKTYESPSDGIGRYVYVRWEAADDDKADGFRIKVVPYETDCSGLQDVMVTVSDFNMFIPEHIPKGRFPSISVVEVPKKSQLMLTHEHKQKMCSPVSCSMIIEYMLRKKVDPLTFAQSSYDDGLRVYGSWPINMAHAYELMSEKGLCYVTRLHSFKELHELLCCNVPVAVSVRGTIVGAPKAYANGHLLVVVGYDADEHAVVCHDPAALTHDDTLKKYDLQSFVRAWERSRRLAYVIMMHTG